MEIKVGLHIAYVRLSIRKRATSNTDTGICSSILLRLQVDSLTLCTYGASTKLYKTVYL